MRAEYSSRIPIKIAAELSYFDNFFTGRHKYLQFFIHLDDYTDRGTPWPFYEQAEIIDYEDASGDIDALRPELQFRKFQGSIDSDHRLQTYNGNNG